MAIICLGSPLIIGGLVTRETVVLPSWFANLSLLLHNVYVAAVIIDFGGRGVVLQCEHLSDSNAMHNGQIILKPFIIIL